MQQCEFRDPDGQPDSGETRALAKTADKYGKGAKAFILLLSEDPGEMGA